MSVRKLLENAKENKLSNGKLQCPYCEKQLDGRGFTNHVKSHGDIEMEGNSHREERLQKQGPSPIQRCNSLQTRRDYSTFSSEASNVLQRYNSLETPYGSNRCIEEEENALTRFQQGNVNILHNGIGETDRGYNSSLLVRSQSKEGKLKDAKQQCPHCQRRLDKRGYTNHVKSHQRSPCESTEITRETLPKQKHTRPSFDRSSSLSNKPSVESSTRPNRLQRVLSLDQTDASPLWFETTNGESVTNSTYASATQQLSIFDDLFKERQMNTTSVIPKSVYGSKQCIGSQHQRMKQPVSKSIHDHLPNIRTLITDSEKEADALINSSSKSSVNMCRKLNSRLANLALKRKDIKRKSEQMNVWVKHLCGILNDKCQLGIKYSQANTGSYYEKVKITKIDEIDCLIVCQLPTSLTIEYEDCPQGAFVKLKILNRDWSKTERLCNDDGCLNPKMFRAYLEKLIRQAQRCFERKSPEISKSFMREHPQSPAVTMKMHSSGLYMDFVPAIEFQGWPKVSKNWSVPAKLQSSREDIKSKFHLVPKIHHSESQQTNDCKLWRLSYSIAEKHIITKMDSGLEGKQSTTCRKDVLKLLKSDLSEAKSQFGEDLTKSYIAKTLVMHMIKLYPRDKQWSKDRESGCLLQKYIHTLLVMKKTLEQGFVEHFFIDGINVIETSQCSLTMLADYEIGKMVRYVRSRIDETLA